MTEPKFDQVETAVIEIAPGWLVVRICDPKPAPHLIEPFLQRTIADWFSEHPGLFMELGTLIVHRGELLGMNVWYQDASKSPLASYTDPTDAAAFDIEIVDAVHERFSNEYCEACIAAAIALLPRAADRPETLVVVSPRRLVVQIDMFSRRICVVGVEIVLGILTGPHLDRLQAWLKAPLTKSYVLHISGFWLANITFDDDGVE